MDSNLQLLVKARKCLEWFLELIGETLFTHTNSSYCNWTLRLEAGTF